MRYPAFIRSLDVAGRGLLEKPCEISWRNGTRRRSTDAGLDEEKWALENAKVYCSTLRPRILQPERGDECRYWFPDGEGGEADMHLLLMDEWDFENYELGWLEQPL